MYVCFCNPNKEEVYKLDYSGKQDSSRIALVRRLILLREEIILNYDADYIIIDTSPGIRYWSINALGIADTLFLTLKMGSLDINGTKKWHFRLKNDPEKFEKETFVDRIKEIRFAIKEFEKLHDKAPAADNLFRAKILREIERSKRTLSEIQVEYEMFKKYKTRIPP